VEKSLEEFSQLSRKNRASNIAYTIQTQLLYIRGGTRSGTWHLPSADVVSLYCAGVLPQAKVF